MKRILLGLAFFSLSSHAFAQKATDFTKFPDLITQAVKNHDQRSADSLSMYYIDNYLVKLKKEELMTRDHLLFIGLNLNRTGSKAFNLFLKQRVRINSILGPEKAEYVIRGTIAREFVPDESKWLETSPDWDALEKSIARKFGMLGLEMIYGKRMQYSFLTKDWENYSKYYKLYFETALKRPEWNINNMSWALFENVKETKTLEFATNVVMKYAMTQWYQNDLQAYDTYANLLYKIGQTEAAIQWEERALKAAKGIPFFEKQFSDALEKMRKGAYTWNQSN